MVTALLLLEPWLWTADLAAQFRVQYLVAGLPLTAVAAAARRWRLTGLSLLSVGVHAVVVLRPGGPALAPAGPHANPPLRVLLINVHTQNREIGRTVALIDDLNPDVIALLEVNRRWMEALQPALTGWPHTVARTREDNFGIAAWSRLVPSEFEVFDLDERGLPAVRGTFVHPEGECRLVVGHPEPPVSHERWRARNAQTVALFEALDASSASSLLLGDFNAVPWSWRLRHLARAHGVRDARRGFGLGASWPADSTTIRLPLDLAYVGAHWGVTAYRTERPIGSDHLPVYLELRRRPARDMGASGRPPAERDWGDLNAYRPDPVA